MSCTVRFTTRKGEWERGEKKEGAVHLKHRGRGQRDSNALSAGLPLISTPDHLLDKPLVRSHGSSPPGSSPLGSAEQRLARALQAKRRLLQGRARGRNMSRKGSKRTGGDNDTAILWSFCPAGQIAQPSLTFHNKRASPTH